MREEAITFGESGRLVGIITDPPERLEKRPGLAVILLNAGIVHRTGPARIYVKIARELAAVGCTTLRFDFSGIGDSPVRQDSVPFERSAVQETQNAMDFLRVKRGIDRFILLGGCSGAYLSLQTACCDPRVAGAILINFAITIYGADTAERKALHYYYNFALFSIQSWRNLLRGGADYLKILRALRFQFMRKISSPQQIGPEESAMLTNLRLLIDRGVRVAFVCSEGDTRLGDLRAAGGDELKQFCSTGKVGLDIIPRSDHNFSSLRDHERLLRVVHERVNQMCSATTQLDECSIADRVPTASVKLHALS